MLPSIEFKAFSLDDFVSPLLYWIFANDNNGKFPEKLEDLENYLGNLQILESSRKPAGFDGPSYILVAGQDTSSNPQNILVYENPEFSGDRINAAFVDSHVQVMSSAEFYNALEATRNRIK